MIKVFLSYSRNNGAAHAELEKLLGVMKRIGLIGSWYSQRVSPVRNPDPRVMENLETSQLVLLLVSHDLVASDYYYEKEMLRAMLKHVRRELVIVPLIFEPCGWAHTPLGKLTVLPRGGRPISQFTDRNDAYLEIASGLEEILDTEFRSLQKGKTNRVAASVPDKNGAPAGSGPAEPGERKKYSGRDDDDFIRAAFTSIKDYFEDAIEKLQERDSHIQADLKTVGNSKFDAVIFVDGAVTSECSIWLSREGPARESKGIKYSSNPGRKSWDESLMIDDIGDVRFLKPLSLHLSRDRSERFDKKGAAEYYWKIFLGPLQ